MQQLKSVFSSVLAAVETTPKIMFKLLSCCIILSLLPYYNAQRVQKFDIEVDSAVKWSTNILRSKGNHFPGGPTLSARHTSLNALVKNLLSHSDNFFNRWSKSVGLFLTTFYCLFLISITHHPLRDPKLIEKKNTSAELLDYINPYIWGVKNEKNETFPGNPKK